MEPTDFFYLGQKPTQMIPKLITWTQSKLPTGTSLKSILIVHLDPDLSSDLSRSGFPAKEELLNVQVYEIVVSVS